jgi:hypothetical protein
MTLSIWYSANGYQMRLPTSSLVTQINDLYANRRIIEADSFPPSTDTDMPGTIFFFHQLENFSLTIYAGFWHQIVGTDLSFWVC